MIDCIFEEIRAERRRQDEKWGKQNHPMLGKSRYMDEVFPGVDNLTELLRDYRARCSTNKYGWYDVLQEEICEAFSETDLEKQREKMVQVAAVAVAIIECLDRRGK